MRVVSTVSTAIVALAVVSCAERSSNVAVPAPTVDRAAQVAGEVVVLVRDTTDAPIAGASIRVLGRRLGAMTDEFGRALVTNVPPGLAQVRVALVGYVQAGDSVLIQVGRVDTLRFRLAIDPHANPPDVFERR